MPCKSRRRAAKRRSIRCHMPIPGKAKHPVPHANPRVEQPEQPLVTELSVVVLQQEVVVPPLFEGRACCETDAGCVFYDGGAGGGKTPQTLP